MSHHLKKSRRLRLYFLLFTRLNFFENMSYSVESNTFFATCDESTFIYIRNVD